MRANLTKREISWVPTKELNYRFCRLMLKGETMPAGIITYADMRETLWIEDELHRRLIVAIGHDFYPPEGVSKPTMANLRAQLSPFKKSSSAPRATQIIHPCSAAVTKKVTEKTDGMLRFKIVITSSIGSVVTTQNVKVNSKSDADSMARKLIEQLGLKQAKYKIS